MVISKKLNKILNKLEATSVVAHKLLNPEKHGLVENSDIGYLDFSKDVAGQLSYVRLPSDNPWDDKSRVRGRVGRVLNKLFKDHQFDANNLGLFTSELHALILSDDFKIQIYKGKDINYTYHGDNYAVRGGSASFATELTNSCMRHDYVIDEGYLNMYTENPDQVSVVAVLNSSERIEARAIVWTIHKTTGGRTRPIRLLDRIYFNENIHRELLINWAYDNNIIPFYELKVFSTFSVALEKWDFKNYPYCDSFKYLDPNTGKLYIQKSDVPETTTVIRQLQETQGEYHELVRSYRDSKEFIGRASAYSICLNPFSIPLYTDSLTDILTCELIRIKFPAKFLTKFKGHWTSSQFIFKDYLGNPVHLVNLAICDKGFINRGANNFVEREIIRYPLINIPCGILESTYSTKVV